LSALVQFIAAHPWWTLIYLVVVASGGVVRITVTKRRVDE
jgi:hypothetical protein